MASHAQIEEWWAGRRCQGPHVSLDLNGRYPVRLQPELEAAGVALSLAITDNGYKSPMGATGSYSCRTIGGSDTWSLHAYAVAIDWDYPSNPYLRGTRIERGFGTDPRFDLTEEQVDAVEAIKNQWGESIWRWLGWTIGDTMHVQVDVEPSRCQPYTTGEDDMPEQQWYQMIDALFIGSDEFQGDPNYWKGLDPDSGEWQDFWAAFVRAIT